MDLLARGHPDWRRARPRLHVLALRGSKVRLVLEARLQLLFQSWARAIAQRHRRIADTDTIVILGSPARGRSRSSRWRSGANDRARPWRLRSPGCRSLPQCGQPGEAIRDAVYAVAAGACDIALALGVEKLKDGIRRSAGRNCLSVHPAMPTRLGQPIRPSRDRLSSQAQR
jgi:hypothetical protein